MLILSRSGWRAVPVMPQSGWGVFKQCPGAAEVVAGP